MTNLLIIIAFNLFLYLFFHKLISNKWLPNKNTVITIIIGILIVPLAIIIEKYFKSINTITEQQYNLIVAITEEILKLTPILILLNFIKFRKFTFIEILGIGIGFAFLESVIYGQGQILGGSYLYPGLPTTLYVSFLTLILRSLGALILHTSTVTLMGIILIYLKNKKRLLILLVLPIVVYIHYLFNEYTYNNSDNFLTALVIISLFFITIYSLYIYINYKINNLEKIKTVVTKISKFILKYIILFILSLGLLVLIDQINFPGLQRYSIKEIEQAKIHQDKIREVAKSWQSEDITKRYNESTDDLFKLRTVYDEIDNTYAILIKNMEENKKLTDDGEEFLKSRGLDLTKEIQFLTIKMNLNSWKKDISGIKIVQNKYSDYFNSLNLPNNISLDFSNFNDLSSYIINTDGIIIDKIESNQELSDEEINYSNNIRTTKMNELNVVYGRLNKYIERVK